MTNRLSAMPHAADTGPRRRTDGDTRHHARSREPRPVRRPADGKREGLPERRRRPAWSKRVPARLPAPGTQAGTLTVRRNERDRR